MSRLRTKHSLAGLTLKALFLFTLPVYLWSAPGGETAKGKPSTEEKLAGEEDSAEDLFKNGRDALFKGDYAQAIELLKKAVSADKTKTNYRLHLARAFRYAGMEEKAVKHLEEILKVAPDHVQAGQALAEIHFRHKRWKQVINVLEPLLKYRHDYPTYHMLAEAYYNMGNEDKARENYEEAVKLNPKSVSDHYQLGNIYLGGNFFTLAAESYQSALRLGLESPVLHYKLGSAYFNQRNYFGRISVRNVKSGTAGTIHKDWYLIERVPGKEHAFRCSPKRSAVYQVAKALEGGIKEGPDIHILMAAIYLNARRYSRAYQMFEETAGKVPEKEKALFFYYFARAAFGIGKYDRYLELLKKAIQLNPKAYEASLVEAYLKVADQHNQAGRLDKYIEFLKKAVSESPKNASLHLKLGNAYEEVQNYGRAIVQWEMVLDLEPDHSQRLELLNMIGKYRRSRDKAQ